MNNVHWIEGSYFESEEYFINIYEFYKDYKIININEDTDSEFLYKELSSNSIFSDNKKLFKIRSLSKDLKDKDLKKILSIIEKTNFIIIFINVSNKILSKSKNKYKIYQSLNNININDAKKYISLKSEQFNLKINDETIGVIVENIKKSPFEKEVSIDSICNYLFKIKSYIDNTKVTIDDVNSVKTSILDVDIWKVFDLLDSSDKESAKDMIFIMAENSGGYKKFLNQFVILLFWRYNLLFLVKETKINDSQKSVDSLFDYFKGYNKLTKEGTALYASYRKEESPLYSYNFIKRVISGFYGSKPIIEMYSRKKLYLIIKLIEEVTEQVRQDTNNIECGISLFTLIDFMCQKTDYKTIVQIRNNKNV